MGTPCFFLSRSVVRVILLMRGFPTFLRHGGKNLVPQGIGCQMNRELEKSRLWIVLATVAINIMGVVVFSKIPWSNWRTGFFLNVVDNLILIGFAVKNRDRLLGHLLLFGVVLGFVELFADAYLVDGTKTLDYSIGGGPMIWRSPIWMPFAWEVVGVQFGYIGMRMLETWGLTGWILAGVLGGLNIPFYEEMALKTHWWRYAQCKMFLHTPYYIILGEFLIVLSFAVLARTTRKLDLRRTVFSGVAAGISIYICYGISYMLLR